MPLISSIPAILDALAHAAFGRDRRALLAGGMALLWLCSGIEGSVHEATTQHVVCAEHGVVEDVEIAGADPRRAGPPTVSDADPSDGHDRCDHLATLPDPLSVPPPPAATRLLPAPPPLDDRAPTVASVDATSPRGPPILSFASKTSPPPRT